MVKQYSKAIVKILALGALCLALQAQTDADRERRLAELERKMRSLDPSFPSAPGASLDARLAVLERSMEALAAERSPQHAVPAPAVEAAAVTSGSQKPADEETRLPVAGYMEAHFNKDAGEPGRADFHRFVLLFGHSFSDRIKFWSELEVEHAIVEGGEEKGEVALEQAYLDFLVKPWLNFRAGMLLAPVGIINERHEPPAFNGVERPFVETVVLPTTWSEMGVGLTGDVGHGLRYRTYMVSALNPAGFNAEEGIRNGRSEGFSAPFRNPAIVGRLEFSGIHKLTLGLSGYSGVSSGIETRVAPRVGIASFDGRYSAGAFDFRGLYAKTWITHTHELNAALERAAGVSPNIARQLLGYYLEPAVHVFPRRLRSDLILFTRYEKFNTQHRMASGLTPLPEFDRSAVVAGVTFKPNADIAIKFDYVFNRNAGSVIRPVNGINLGLGWWF